jgi:REP element-mobilizing transposase RayT
VVFYFAVKIIINFQKKTLYSARFPPLHSILIILFYINMSQTIYQVWLHTVFTTKDRQPLITPDLEEVLYPFLYDEFSELDCKLNIVNGLADHIHCLFMLNGKHSLSAVMKQIKGASSHYINQQDIIKEKFCWQKGYAAFSVSECMVPSVIKFIKKQKIKRMTLEEEGLLL